MLRFTITVRFATSRTVYTVLATSSCDAWLFAASAQGDAPCAITVLPAANSQ